MMLLLLMTLMVMLMMMIDASLRFIPMRMIQVPHVTRRVVWLFPMERHVPFLEEVRMIIIIIIMMIMTRITIRMTMILMPVIVMMFFFSAVYKYRCNSGLEMDGPDTVSFFFAQYHPISVCGVGWGAFGRFKSSQRNSICHALYIFII